MTIYSATDLLWAVHNPSTKQRAILRALPTTAAGVLVTVASAQVLLEAERASSTLATAAFIARTLGLSEQTVKGHLKSLGEAGLVKAYGVGPFTTYCANGPVILANLEHSDRHHGRR